MCYYLLVFTLNNSPGGMDNVSLAMFCHWSLSLFLGAVPKTGNGANVYDFMQFCDSISKQMAQYSLEGFVLKLIPAHSSVDWNMLLCAFNSGGLFTHMWHTPAKYNPMAWWKTLITCNWATVENTCLHSPGPIILAIQNQLDSTNIACFIVDKHIASKVNLQWRLRLWK